MEKTARVNSCFVLEAGLALFESKEVPGFLRNCVPKTGLQKGIVNCLLIEVDISSSGLIGKMKLTLFTV